MASGSVNNSMDIQNEIQDQIVINYKEVKRKYEENMIKANVPVYTKKQIQDTIEVLSDGTLVSDVFEFEIRHSEPKLFLKFKHLEVVPLEETYDLILEKHFEINHGDARITSEFLTMQYFIPKVCIVAVLESCSMCKIDAEIKLLAATNAQAPRKQTKANKLSWRLNIIPYGNSVDNYSLQSFRYLLIYKENNSNYLVLRLLFTGFEEQRIELLKIFLEYGIPDKVFVPNNIVEYYKNTMHKLSLIHPELNSISIKVAPGEIFKMDESEVIMEMEYWKRETNSTNWDIGCYIVQFRINITRKYIIRIGGEENFPGIPFYLFYGETDEKHRCIYKDLISQQPNTE